MKKIAIISATGFAGKRMIPEIQKSSTCKIVAIQGRSSEKLKNLAKEFSIPKIFSSIEEMMANHKYDAVYVANPPFLHIETISKIIKYNIPILCEKPLVFSMNEIQEIENILTDFDANFMIGHHIRHQKALIDLQNLLARGVIGNIEHVDAEWSYSLNPDSSYAQWKLNPNLGGYSVMNDSGIHIIDITLFLFGNPLNLQAKGSSEKYKITRDTASAKLQYKNFQVDIACSQAKEYSRNDLIIKGLQGKIIIRDFFSQEYIQEIVIETTEGKEFINYEPTSLYLNELENLLGISQIGLPGTTLKETKENTNILEKIHTSMKKNSI